WQAKIRAKQINCVSNLHQLTYAAVMYQNDFNLSQGFAPVGTLWTDLLYRYYARGTPVQFCPCAMDREGLGTNQFKGTAANPWIGQRYQPIDEKTGTNSGSYAVNAWLFNVDSTATFRADRQNYFKVEADIQYTSRTPEFIDAVWPNIAPGTND